MSTFNPVAFIKGGVVEVAFTRTEYWQHVWDGWIPTNLPPTLPRNRQNASLADLDALQASLVGIFDQLISDGGGSGASAVTIVDNGDDTFTIGGSTSVIADNGDGTFTIGS